MNKLKVCWLNERSMCFVCAGCNQFGRCEQQASKQQDGNKLKVETGLAAPLRAANLIFEEWLRKGENLRAPPMQSRKFLERKIVSWKDPSKTVDKTIQDRINRKFIHRDGLELLIFCF